jgi:hypothetical protein
MKSTPNRPPRRVLITFDTWLSVAAVVTSVCALTITIYQAYLQRKQQYASVMPVLDLYGNNGNLDGDKTYRLDIVLTNNGIGPAFVRRFEYWYKGKRQGSFNEIVGKVAQEVGIKDVNNVVYSGLWEGRVIPQNQEVKLISIADDALGRQFYERGGSMRLRIWYESIYGETWRIDTAPDRPEERLVKID